MLNNYFKPTLYTRQYYESQNVFKLCLDKYNLNKYEINAFIKEYNLGYATFEQTKYLDENRQIMHNCSGICGHPFESIIKFLSIYGKNSNCTIFNDILLNIYDTPTNNNINLKDCLIYFNKQDEIKEMLKKNHADFDILFLKIYHKLYQDKINVSNMYITCTRNLKHNQKSIFNIYLENKYDNLTDYLINKSNYNKIIFANPEFANTNEHYYEKTLIINTDIIYMTIGRLWIDSHGEKIYKNDKMIIPKKLKLPYFCFYDNIVQNYELIGIVMCDFQKKNYSIIINQNNNYFHYLNEGILQVDDDYFNTIIATEAWGVFYKAI